MQGPIRSIFAGVVSGVATYFVSLYALGFTNAFVMPSWASLAVWNAVVVLGLGATLVALVIHFVTLRLFAAKGPLALASFFGATLVAMALAGALALGAKTLLAWVLGAFLASLAYRRCWVDGPCKPTPLSGAA